MEKRKGKKKLDKRGVISHTTSSSREDGESDIIFEESAEEAGVAQKIKKLRDELKTCRSAKEAYLAGWQRAKADLVNLRRQEEARRADLLRHGEERILLDLIPALDSFDMAFSNKEAWEKADTNWRKGVEYIHSQLLSVLRQYGCEPFSPEGESFDPSRHDSIESVPVEDRERDHTIVTVLQKGYLCRGKVIRPAKVTVGEYK